MRALVLGSILTMAFIASNTLPTIDSIVQSKNQKERTIASFMGDQK